MPIACTFRLNSRPTSDLCCAGVGNYPAFSGNGTDTNNPAGVGHVNTGAIPPGLYYVLQRASGGTLGFLRDLLGPIASTDRSQWFALYRNDGVIDDETYINQVRRGEFRLHPIGPLGISQGCITLFQVAQFNTLRQRLLATTPISIPNTALRAFGTVTVS